MSSPGMHILTGNAYTHRECTKFIQGVKVIFNLEDQLKHNVEFSHRSLKHLSFNCAFSHWKYPL